MGNETSRVNDGTSNAKHMKESTGDRFAAQDIKCKSEEMQERPSIASQSLQQRLL